MRQPCTSTAAKGADAHAAARKRREILGESDRVGKNSPQSLWLRRQSHPCCNEGVCGGGTRREFVFLQRSAALRDRHLRDVDEGTLRASDDHPFGVVVLLQTYLRVLTKVVSSEVQFSLYTALEGLADGHSWCSLQPIVMSVFDDAR